MTEELRNASKLLNTVLDQYITACSAIVNRYDFNVTLKSIAQEISDTLLNELELISTYKAKIKHAKAVINQTRNVIPATTPVHMLPPSVLSYIFQLVRDAQPGYCDKKSRPSTPTYLLPAYSLPTHSPPNYPETLSCVCSHWRRIVMESRALWSHIQISDGLYYCNTRLFTRARVFATRSTPLPVDIHIIVADSNGYYSIPELNEFLASVATRIRSFHLSPKSGTSSFTMTHTSALESWLANCQSGTLNELVLKGGTFGNSFVTIEASETPILPDSQLLEMPHEYLEDRLRSVRVLRLTGLYFPWESQAYHGLVELRLIPLSGGVNHTISQSRFREILMASPRLRELHFGLDIVEMLPHSEARTVVELNDLEVVNLCTTKWGGQGAYNAVLQLLAPGSKPLELSLSCPYTSSRSFLGSDATEFIARSNVTKLHIESIDINRAGKYQPLVLHELFRLLKIPIFRALSLCRFYLRPSQSGCPPYDESTLQIDGTRLEAQIDIVHLRDCTIDQDYLRRVMQIVPVRKINYKGCWFYNMEDGYFNGLENSQLRDNMQDNMSDNMSDNMTEDMHDNTQGNIQDNIQDDISPIFNNADFSWLLDESDPWVQPVLVL